MDSEDDDQFEVEDFSAIDDENENNNMQPLESAILGPILNHTQNSSHPYQHIPVNPNPNLEVNSIHMNENNIMMNNNNNMLEGKQLDSNLNSMHMLQNLNDMRSPLAPHPSPHYSGINHNMSPHAMSPHAMSPHAMSPHAMSPHAMSPHHNNIMMNNNNNHLHQPQPWHQYGYGQGGEVAQVEEELDEYDRSLIAPVQGVRKINSKDLANTFFDCFFQVNLSQDTMIFKDVIWAVGWHTVGDKIFTSLQSWLGKFLRSRVVDAKKQEFQAKHPSYSEQQLKEMADSWLVEREKTLKSTREGRKTVYFVNVRPFDGRNPPEGIKLLAETSNREIKDMIFQEKDLPEMVKNYKISSALTKSKTKKRKKDQEPAPVITNSARGGLTQRSKAVLPNDPHYAMIPFIQIHEASNYIKIFTHTPFLTDQGLKCDTISTTAIKFSGMTQVPTYLGDAIVFRSGWIKDGSFERIVQLHCPYEAKTVTKSGAGSDFSFVLQKRG